MPRVRLRNRPSPARARGMLNLVHLVVAVLADDDRAVFGLDHRVLVGLARGEQQRAAQKRRSQ